MPENSKYDHMIALRVTYLPSIKTVFDRAYVDATYDKSLQMESQSVSADYVAILKSETDFLTLINEMDVQLLDQALVKAYRGFGSVDATALHFASKYESEAVFLTLMKRASVEAINEALVEGTWYYGTALQLAAGYQSEPAFLALVNKACSEAINKALNKVDKYDTNALYVAAGHQSQSAFLGLVNKVSVQALDKALVKADRDGRWTALHVAALYQSEASFLALINKASVGAVSNAMVIYNFYHNTTLHSVAEKSEAVFLALVNKANVESLNQALRKKNQYGKTPLHLAAQHQTETAFLALALKVDSDVLSEVLDQPDNQGLTPLQLLKPPHTKADFLDLVEKMRIQQPFVILEQQKTKLKQESDEFDVSETEATKYFDLLVSFIKPDAAKLIPAEEKLEKIKILLSVPAINKLVKERHRDVWREVLKGLSKAKDKNTNARIAYCLIEEGVRDPKKVEVTGATADIVTLIKAQAIVVSNEAYNIKEKVEQLIFLVQQMNKIYQNSSFLFRLDEEVDVLFMGDLLIGTIKKALNHADNTFKEQTIENSAQQLAVYQLNLQAIEYVQGSPLVQNNYMIFNLLLGYFKPNFSVQLQGLKHQVSQHIDELTKSIKSKSNTFAKIQNDNTVQISEKAVPILSKPSTQVTPQPISNPYVDSPLSLPPVEARSHSPVITESDRQVAANNPASRATAVPETMLSADRLSNYVTSFFHDLSRIVWPRVPNTPLSQEKSESENLPVSNCH